jgi:hypothetical protein
MRGEIGGGEGSWSMASWGVYFGGSFPARKFAALLNPLFSLLKEHFLLR